MTPPEQLYTTVVIQIDDEVGEMDFLNVTVKEALAGLISDGYTGAYAKDSKVYLLPIRTADYSNIHYVTQEEWDSEAQ